METPLHKQETKRDLAASSVSIFGGGGGKGESDLRETEFSKFEGWGARFHVLPGLVSKGVGVPLALRQVHVLRATRLVGGLGRRSSPPGAEVRAKLRQLACRHFNCGFLGPLAALRAGGCGWGWGGSRLGFPSRLFPPLFKPPPLPAAPAADSSPAGSRRGRRGHPTR